MYFVRHLPSKTYYGLHSVKNMNSSHAIVCFRSYEEALHVGNSIATFQFKNKTNPDNSKLCCLEKKDIKNDALDMGLYIEHIAMDEPFIANLFGRNINLEVMTDINKNMNSINLTNTYHRDRFEIYLEDDLYLES
jgi:hypothetical protein